METNEDTIYRFQLPPAEETPQFDATGLPKIAERDFGRITVLLGANGSGKSRLLKSLSVFPIVNGIKRPVVYVEGGRAIKFPQDIDIGLDTGQYVQTQNLTDRVQTLLAMLETERADAVNSYTTELYKWAAHTIDPKPVEKTSRLKRINEVFSRLLPRRAFSMTPNQRTPLTEERALRLRNWYMENNGVSYNIRSLSDGEKQVLCLLGDVGEFAPSGAIILVDEPELNLHPSLAMELWSYLEQKNEDAVFVYATHSLSFAMRPSVSDIIVLGGASQDPLHLKTPADLASDDLEPFLGSIAAIITSKRVLVVEGNDGRAFDKSFYQWAVGPHVSIANVGSCHGVRAAMNHEGIWQKAGSVAICGIVDRDFRTESRLEDFRQAGCEVLPYHEAESYLCYPQLLVEASALSGKNKTLEEIIEMMAQLCDAKVPMVAMQRAISRSEVRLSIGPAKGESLPKDDATAKSTFQTWIKLESPRANKFEKEAMQVLEEELTRCRHAVAEKDVQSMLALFPGKEMLKPLLFFAGFQGQPAFEKSVYRFLNPNDYPPLVAVFEPLRKKFA